MTRIDANPESVTVVPSAAPISNAAAPPGDPLSRSLGAKIRSLRKEAGLTLEALAAVAGVSRSLISAIERGHASPSISTLRGIAAGVGVPVAELFMGDEDAAGPDRDPPFGPRIVTRREERKRLVSGPSGAHYELLTPDVKRQIEFLLVEFEPATGVPTEPAAHVAHVGEENALCLEGNVVFTIDGTEFLVRAGDSISFDCSVPHRLDNRAAVKATLVFAISPPGF